MFRQQIYRTERNKWPEEKVTVENKDTKGSFPWTFLHQNKKVYRAEQDSRVGWRPQNRQPVRQNKSLVFGVFPGSAVLYNNNIFEKKNNNSLFSLSTLPFVS